MLIILVSGRHRDYLPQVPQNLATPLHAHRNQRHKTSSLSYDTHTKKKRNKTGLPTLHRLTQTLKVVCIVTQEQSKSANA